MANAKLDKWRQELEPQGKKSRSTTDHVKCHLSRIDISRGTIKLEEKILHQAHVSNTLGQSSKVVELFTKM